MHEGTTMTGRSGTSDGRDERVGRLRTWLERLLIWRVWERMLEIEFLDRSVALAGKAFVSFFPLVIVVAAFVPAGTRASIDFSPSPHGSACGETPSRSSSRRSRHRTTSGGPPECSASC